MVFGTWKIQNPVGTGTYGKVYKIENHDGTVGAYKIMKIPVKVNDDPSSFPKKTPEMCLKEVRKDISGSIKYLQMYDKGRYFVSYEDCMFTPSNDWKTLTLQIRTEWLMSLSEIIRKTVLSEDEILRLAINVCTCLEKCREMDYVYPNLKPDNIFVTPKRCKLGDFGNFGNYEPINMNVSMRKTQEFSAPELIKFGELNYTSDTYSLGMVLYYLLNNNRIPFIPAYTKNIGISDITSAIEKRCSNYVFPNPDNGCEAVRKIIEKACSSSVAARYQTPTEMKNDLIFVLEKQEEILGIGKAKKENAPKAEKVEEAPAPSVESVKTYEYDDSKKVNISIDKKKKILLVAIAVVFAVLVGLIIATVVRDVQASVIVNPSEVFYGWGQTFSFDLIR